MVPSLPQSLPRGLSFSRSLPQSCTEVSSAPICDYPNYQHSAYPECTSITPRAFRSTCECSCRVWELRARLQEGLGATGGIAALLRSRRVSRRFACGFVTNLCFADKTAVFILRWQGSQGIVIVSSQMNFIFDVLSSFDVRISVWKRLWCNLDLL